MPALCAGLLLALFEIALVLVLARDQFLSWRELVRYAVLALTALPALCCALGFAVQRVLFALGSRSAPAARFEARVRWLVLAVATPGFATLAWLLSAGRRLRDLPARPWLVVLAGACAAAVLSVLLVRLVRASASGRRLPLHALLLSALCAGAIALDMLLFKRLYPALHVALACGATSAALAAGAALSLPSPRQRTWPGWRVSLPITAAALLSIYSLSSAPNARFAIMESAPLTGRLLRASLPRGRAIGSGQTWTARPPGAVSFDAVPQLRTGSTPGVDLRRRDILLITVDALRADQLRAYGGHGLTPAIDQLAETSAVFSRAYTPTPHTSYAIASFLTGKFMRPLLSLAAPSEDHATLPRSLRRYGYRTAAFYPPAIFFVDGERFLGLQRQQFGFEYVKAMFASASDRVQQLEQYLREVTPSHPLFVWVHLFEPHEPYDPPAEFARGDTPLARYQGEVAAADAGVRRLVDVFRNARPGATVILTADHGEEFGEHGGSYHGTTLFDEQVRVPVLWSSPGVVKPRVIDAPIEILDLTTTLLSALGIPRDARMRGDDLSALLAGATAPDHLRAYASIESEHMWTDGRAKLICGEYGCRLFDLRADPRERRDLSQERTQNVTRLRFELEALMASFPRVEALAMEGGGPWPEALARARLGDAAAVPQLIPLLQDGRPAVRGAAARALGELGGALARGALGQLRVHDPDLDVRWEAALAGLRLGDGDAREQVAALLPARSDGASTSRTDVGAAPPPGPLPEPPAALQQRAALALATRGDGAGSEVLLAMALDHALDEPTRLAAVQALGEVGDERIGRGLLPLLEAVRLRTPVAEVLGRIAGADAIPALANALEHERYPAARRAEAEALLALGARRPAVAGIRRFLGTESSIPDGVRLLLEAGDLARASGAGLDIRRAQNVRRGAWICEPQGCRPLLGASIVIPRRGFPPGPGRLTLRAHVQGLERGLWWGELRHELDVGAVELTIGIDGARRPTGLAGREFTLRADAGVLLQALAVVPVQDDVPAPPPEPW